MAKFCSRCGNQLEGSEKFCASCGNPVNSPSGPAVNGHTSYKSKMAAGLLGIFVGSFGIHNFYLGFNGKAVIQSVLTLFTCGLGGIWGFMEGILILAGVINRDADGILLGD